MPLVVESVSATATASSTTLTVTKPAGLVVGELIVAILSSFDTPNDNNGSFNTLSGWTSAVGGNYGNEIGQSIQYKLAASGDVAASNFTFTHTLSKSLVGKIIRVSGNNVLTGGLAATDGQTGGNTGATFDGTITAFTPPVDGALVIMQVGGSASSGSFRTVGSYTVAGTSFTEAYDVSISGSAYGGAAAAYGIQGTAAEISTYKATFSIQPNDFFGQLAVFYPPVNASGTNTLVTTTSASFAQSGTCDTIGGTNVLTATDTTMFAQGGTGTSPIQWTNEAKPSTTWTNEAK